MNGSFTKLISEKDFVNKMDQIAQYVKESNVYHSSKYSDVRIKKERNYSLREIIVKNNSLSFFC